MNTAFPTYVLADPADNLPNAQTPDQCNSVERPDNTVVKKSINPLCQICIGIGDEVGHPYAAPDGYIGAQSTSTHKVSCTGSVSGGFNLTQAQNDWNLMCSSRGGTPGGEFHTTGTCTPGGGCGVDSSVWAFTCQF